MEALLNAFNNYQEHEYEIHAICERITGVRGEFMDVFINPHDPLKHTIMYEHYANGSRLSAILVFHRYNGFSIAQFATGEDGWLREDPQKVQEAETRCEQLNAELIH